MKCGNKTCDDYSERHHNNCGVYRGAHPEEACKHHKPLNSKPDAGANVSLDRLVKWHCWLITIFWEAHKGKDGCQYPGGYETYCVEQHPVDYMIGYIKEYGHIVKLINSEPMTKEQSDKYAAI